MHSRPPAAEQTWLVAPDSFKGTFSAGEVTEALASGLRAAGSEVDLCPLADGGEGTMRVLLDALGGKVDRVLARDPLGRPVEAELGLLDDGRTAIVETAAASGLGLVDAEKRDAEAASSAGTGDLIALAGRLGAERILVAVGGSACTDGGRGAIEAVYAAGGLHGARIEVLCDTHTPFERAAIVFGPQKGADDRTVARLTNRLLSLVRSFPRDPRGVPMTGCAGGLSGGLWACFDAQLRSGADAILDAVEFDRRAAQAGLVVTGEGRLDTQSVDGKLLSVVARRARAVGARTHVVVGQLRLSDHELERLGIDGGAIEASSLEQLQEAGERLGRSLSSSRLGALAGQQAVG
jgi:glycerate 2-kinase